ncbi:response regulator [Muricomes sp. OA1]|uniref:response regulator transcription factor n=1 Tax=Muricomes sp. OA1 TaxID=2914165 RepID=UPI0004705780|nr:response regulator [Muricomes sp. OA1]MCH1972795.1 response regulator [Muricomes sp. OA1]MEE0199505.1 response regulator [Muricomes sp.]
MYSYIVIDDEVIIRKGLIKKISDIKDSNYECVGEAENGLRGLELVKEKNPDIIITDMKMNKMDGVQFLETLKDSRLKQPVIVISSFKDFEYMHKAIESRVIGYVLKPFSSEEIGKQLEKAVKEIESRCQLETIEAKIQLLEQEDKNRALQDLIMGNPDGLALNEADYPVCLYARLVSVNHKIIGAYETCFSICQEHAQSMRWAVIKNTVQKSQFFILLYTEKERESYLRLKTNQIVKSLADNFQEEEMVCVISRTTRSIHKLNSLRKDNDKALHTLLPGVKRRILNSGEPVESRMIYSAECMDSWFGRMKYDPAEVTAVMDSFFDNIDITQFTMGDVRKTCGYMVKKVNEYAEEQSIEKDDIMRYFDTRYLFDENLDRMKRETAGYITLIFQSVDGREERGQDLFEMIDSYIHKNYNKKITLSMIAESIYANPAICRNILREKGISFNEYLTEIRIEHAKLLLTDSDAGIEYISSEIGYTNPKYFFKVFKKSVGETPQEYRKNRRGSS